MSIKPDYENSPEFLAVTEKENAIRKQYQVLRDTLNGYYDEKETLKNSWWKENLHKFNFFDREDFFTIGNAGWDNGSGDSTITAFVENVLVTEGVSDVVSVYGHHNVDNKNNDSVYAFSVSITNDMSNETLEKVSSFLQKVASVAKARAQNYLFNVSGSFSNEQDWDGPLYLKVAKHNLSYAFRRTYGYSTGINTVTNTGSVSDVLKELRLLAE
jgi:hypothetical protein